jgi:hypothetical protein
VIDLSKHEQQGKKQISRLQTRLTRNFKRNTLDIETNRKIEELKNEFFIEINSEQEF